MRLVGGKLFSEGRVEIYYNGQWGTVCDDNWDMAEAQVVCRHLNFPSALAAIDGGVYGQGSGPIWMDDLNCDGTEKDLSRCGFKGWGVTDCSHSEDAGVVCEKNTGQNNSREYVLDHNTGLSKHLGALFESGRDCDLNITVLVDNGIVETICTHRIILSLDPEASFLNASQEHISSLSINVSPNCRPHVKQFIRYLYTRQINVTVSSAQCIHKMASEWGLEKLQKASGSLFTWLLPEDPTFKTQNSLYEYSVFTGDLVLQETCLRYLAWNCETLIRSPAWTGLALATIKALLARSDLVLPNEAYLLKGLETWEVAQVNSSTSTDPLAILNLIRFPMISVEDLYRLDSPRYDFGKLQGYQFNSLPVALLLEEFTVHKKMYTPRIYTGKPWSFTFSTQDVNNYKDQGYYTYKDQRHNTLDAYFLTPVHNSAYFTFSKNINWYTKVYTKSHECSNNGIICPSLPVARLDVQGSSTLLPSEFQNKIVYHNKVVLMCEGEYVFQVQNFKVVGGHNLALIPSNSSAGQAYPCHSDQFSYRMVVRPICKDSD
ncbi:galectin-3-binding protein B-like [Aplochiton taeniatus]